MKKSVWAILALLLGLGGVQVAFAEPGAVDRYPLMVDRYRLPAGHPLPVDSSRAAQQTTVNKQLPAPNATPRFSLKNGTLGLLDPVAPSFNIAAEHIIRPRLYAHLEAGPLLNYRLLEEPTVDNLKGYRFRGAIRYYLRPPQIGDYAPFIELMYTHQYTDAAIEGDFRRNNSVGWYRQRITYHMEQRRQGGYVNLGLQKVYSGRFLFEFGAGLGVSHRRSDFSGVPPDASFRTNGGLGWEYERFPTSLNVAAVQVYINLGYVLW